MYPPQQIDADSQPFWGHTRRHELRCQRCTACGRLRFPAAPLCPTCRGADAEWEALSGRGVLRSWTVTHRIAHPAFAAQVPYTSVLVELAEQEGLLLYGMLSEPGPLVAGAPVEAVFVDGETESIVRWRLAP
ncbi:OB-fold domain-containing protein [Pseudonocardia sp. NPDC049154]|uniref:Zn-ribbon domain-containing OB-fold protein n=1 Tax=Pseudonocardia sp. NPDC049154 TaxID=3155501 RepID=UPI0033C0785F